MMQQQPPQQGSMYTLPQGSLQPDAPDFSKSGGKKSRGGMPYEETKYNHFKVEHIQNTCKKQKKIVLDVNMAGFGNKLLAIISTAVLATLMNRIVELDWSVQKNYQSIFSTIPQQPNLELFRDVNSSSSTTWETVVSECNLKFTPSNDFQHFWFLRHPQLFQRMDQVCDIIKITGNTYYAPFLMDPSVFGDLGNKLRQLFTDNPMDTIGKCHLSALPNLQQQSSQILNEMRSSGGKWLSIHARAYYDYSGKASSKAFTCAKKLLEIGAIKKIYFATESPKLMELAKQYFQQFPNALYVSDKMVQMAMLESKNASNIDNEVNVDEAHVVEWLTIGQADYCISPTFEVSSFSNTGLYRGGCKLIPMKAYKDCDLFVQNTSNVHPKRLIFSALNHPRAIRTWNKPVDIEAVWNGLSIVNASSQCHRDRPSEQISQYWSYQNC